MQSVSNQPTTLAEDLEALQQEMNKQASCDSSLHHLQKAIDYFCRQGNATLAYLELTEAMRSLPIDQQAIYDQLEVVTQQLQRG